MSYNRNKEGYEQDPQLWIEMTEMVGKSYNGDAFILDITWHDDDNIAVLMVEEDDEHPDLPFVITIFNIDQGFEIRHDLPERFDSLRDATIMFDHYFR